MYKTIFKVRVDEYGKLAFISYQMNEDNIEQFKTIVKELQKYIDERENIINGGNK